MAQFKDYICFQIPYMRLHLPPCHRKPRLIKWSKICRNSCSYRLRDRCQQCIFLSTWHFPPPLRPVSPPAGATPCVLFSSILPLAPVPLADLRPEPNFPLPSASGTYAISAHPSPSPVQQDQQRQKAYVEFKSEEGDSQKAGRADSLPQLHRNDAPAVLI